MKCLLPELEYPRTLILDGQCSAVVYEGASTFLWIIARDSKDAAPKVDDRGSATFAFSGNDVGQESRAKQSHQVSIFGDLPSRLNTDFPPSQCADKGLTIEAKVWGMSMKRLLRSSCFKLCQRFESCWCASTSLLDI